MPPLMKIALSTAACLFLAWLMLVACMFVFQRKLMYLPDTTPLLPTRVYGIDTLEKVSLTTKDGLSLEAFYMPAQTEEAGTIVLFHGNAGNAGHRIAKGAVYHLFGVGVLLAEYRGYGDNSGTPTEQGLYTDGRAAMDFLTKKLNLPPEKIAIYGESLGSGIAVQMATEYDAAALVLETPFSSTAAVASAIYPFIPAKLLLKDRYDNIAKISHIKPMPVLIVHGTEDGVVPFTEGQKLFEAAVKPKKIVTIEGGNHNNLYDFPATGIEIGGFLGQQGIFQLFKKKN
ncbi:MAG: alpha/beta hydrolase [Alphaproteobacteria bacterium]|nr:MAG: alpha/beta hydrolase [Alphaproteobacteria bacterium]